MGCQRSEEMDAYSVILVVLQRNSAFLVEDVNYGENVWFACLSNGFGVTLKTRKINFAGMNGSEWSFILV